jgi:hypothetical protein
MKSMPRCAELPCGALMIALMAIALVPLPTHAAQQFVFGAMPDGQVVKQYQLTNKRGSKASVITLGATWKLSSCQDGYIRIHRGRDASREP